MQVNTATGASTTTTTPATSTSSAANATSAAATVDYNSFIKLMVAEIQNQDPTNPSDPTQYMSQLASFSAVGQTIQTNSKLDTMLTTSALSQADAAIGRKVTSADGSVSGKVTAVAIESGGTVTALLDNGQTLALGAGTIIQ